MSNLQKSNEVFEHIAIEFWKLFDNIQSTVDVVMVGDTSVVEVIWHKWLIELTVPQLQQ